MTFRKQALHMASKYLIKRNEELGGDRIRLAQELGIENPVEVGEYFHSIFDTTGDPNLGAAAYAGFMLGYSIGHGNIQIQLVRTEEEAERLIAEARAAGIRDVRGPGDLENREDVDETPRPAHHTDIKEI